MSFKNIVRFFKYKFCRIYQINKLKQLRKTKQKIRVLFYVTENQKWCYQSLYDEFDKNQKFEPFVVVSVLQDVHRGNDKTRNNLEENYKFFQSRGMRVEYGYKNHSFVDLKTFKPDIVFYEQKWELPKSHKPWVVAKYALTCACPYSYQLFNNIRNSYSEFYSFMYRYFVTCEQNKAEILPKDSYLANNIQVSGYPKLDVYNQNELINLNLYWKDADKFKIIYAPHHSFVENSLKLSTFLQNGKLILDWAKKHSDTVTWIFKPHPAFRYELIKNAIMTEQEVDEYYNGWSSVGNIYTQGDYFNIFKTSDMMITDSGSFLAEYLPTKKPLIRPINPDAIGLNSIGEFIVSAYYQTPSNDDLLKTLEDVVFKNNDYMKEKRYSVANELFDYDKSAALKIVENIETEIFGE